METFLPAAILYRNFRLYYLARNHLESVENTCVEFLGEITKPNFDYFGSSGEIKKT